MGRVVGIDWSGRVSPSERRFLWVAEADAEQPGLTCLTNMRTRTEVVDHLVDCRPDLVGIDCSFSLPGWWLEANGLSGGPDLWAAAVGEGERWLRECPHPFWGRAARWRRPPHAEPLRATERTVAAGRTPRSTFQVGGAGAVGTGSIRAWPHLHRLRAEGWGIWPWDGAEPGRPLVVEVWPRLFAPGVVKTRPPARAAAAAALGLAPDHAAAVEASDDAFDAAVTAIGLARQWGDLRALEASVDPLDLQEGRIWQPGRPCL